LEKPIVHRYKEIEAFPQALNTSQKWNWSTRLFLTEARENVTADAIAGVPSKWTSEELDALEKALQEHEVWLNNGVERQKKTKMNENPAIETKEMRERAKTLEQHLQRLVKRKAPKVKKVPVKSGDPSGSSSAEPTQTGDRQGHDEL
jgi:hypoxia up-regulated 1